MKRNVLTISMSLALLLLVGCGVSPFPSTGTAAVGGNDTVTEVPLTEGTLFAVHVLTSPEDDGTTFTLQKSCEVPSGTPVGTSMNCTATIPEGTLHFSKLKLQMVVPDGVSCAFAVFHPYYYRASTNVSFLPEWVETAAVCDASVTPIPAECYSGPAPDLVPDFPRFDFIYITPDASGGLETAWTIDSANEKGRQSNRWTNNTLLAGSRTGNLTAVNGNDSYIANTMVDYSFECRDKWYDVNYLITLTIQDEDTGGPACDPNLSSCNQWTNWNSTQNNDM